MAFPLMALGAGLGQFAEQMQQQRAQQERSLMLQMQLANYQREMDKDRRETSAADIFARFDPSAALTGLGGAGGFGAIMPQTGPQGGLSALTGPMPGMGAQATYGAGQRVGKQMSREEALRILDPSSPMVPTTGQAALALNALGGQSLVNEGMQAIGEVPGGGGAPSAAAAPVDQMAPEQAGPFAQSLSGALTAPGGAPVAQAGDTGPPQPPTPPLSRAAIGQMIRADERFKGADYRAVGIAATNLEKALQATYRNKQTEYQDQLKLYHDYGPGWRQRRAADIEDAALKAKVTAEATVGIPPREGPILMRGPGGEMRWVQHGGALPDNGVGWTKVGAGDTAATRRSEQIEVTDPGTGRKIFEGLAHEVSPGQWVDSGSAAPINTTGMKVAHQPASIGITSQNVGNRISMGANEVARAVENMTAMPIGTTLGWFGGAQSMAPKELRAGLQKNLANAITPQSAQMLAAMGRGVERGLGILAAAGAATGLVSLQDSLKGEMPQENDTGQTTLTKFANMRQIVEAANDTIQASSMVPEAQKKQMQVNADRIVKAVPWTVRDVINVTVDPSDETVTQFARKLGLGSKAGPESASPAQQQNAPPPQGARMPLPPEFASKPDGTGWRNKQTGKMWVKQGSEMIETPGAVETPQ